MRPSAGTSLRWPCHVYATNPFYTALSWGCLVGCASGHLLRSNPFRPVLQGSLQENS